jgi:hypothetical protein
MKLKDKDPVKHNSIVKELKKGRPIREIAVSHDVSASTVQSIKYTVPPQDIPSFKRRMSDKYSVAIETLADRLIDEAKTAKGVSNISVALGIIQDKKGLYDGDASQTLRIEHVQLPDTNAIIDLLPAANVLQVSTPPQQTPVNTVVRHGSHNRSTTESHPGEGVSGIVEATTTTD